MREERRGRGSWEGQKIQVAFNFVSHTGRDEYHANPPISHTHFSPPQEVPLRLSILTKYREVRMQIKLYLTLELIGARFRCGLQNNGVK